MQAPSHSTAPHSKPAPRQSPPLPLPPPKSKPRTLSLLLLFSFCLSLSIPPITHAATYDLIIRSGRIVDGTGNPWFHGDIAIRNDRIAAVHPRIDASASLVIDARGLVVAPGFIDIHSHSDWLLLEDGAAQSKIRQGVTTEVIGEGSSVGPSKGKLEPTRVNVRGNTVPIATIQDYFNAIESNGVSVNVATYVGIGNVWECVMGQSFDPPTSADIKAMQELVKEAMQQGALGLSSQLMMPPGLLATTDHVVSLCEVVNKYHGLYSTHIRNEGLGVFEAIEQAIEIGERARVPVDIIHLKIADQKYWGRMNEVIALFESARARGLNVQANVYPYTRGNNNLSSIIPPWAHEGGNERMLQRLGNPADRARMKQDIRNGIDGWYNHFTAVGGDWTRMLVSADNAFKGQTMDQVLARRTEGRNPTPDPLDELFDFLIEENGSVGTVYAHHTEEDMTLALRQPWCSVGSDGSAYAIDGPLRRGNPHPRNFGTFPRLLGRYVREQGLLTLEDAVRKITSLNATKAGLPERGLLTPGFFADITLFDPEKIIDRSEFTDPFHYNEGIVHVIVNGQVVLSNDQHTGAKPGRALRRKTPPSDSPIAPYTLPTLLESSGAGEGPAWHPQLGLLFSGNDRITRRTPEDKTETFREPSGGSNGLLFDHQGRLVVCESGRRRVTRTEDSGTITVLADNYQGAPFNTPNDLTIDSKNRVYFTDPRYGDRSNMAIRDQDGKLVEGVYRIDEPGRVTRIITHEVDRPNGILVTPDDKHLYVADNNNNTAGGARKLWRFDLTPEGTAGNRKLIFDWETDRGPDGMAIDSLNRLYVAAGLNQPQPPYETITKHKGGIYIFSPQGDLLDFVPIPRDEVTNCTFGGPGRTTLFITAGGTLWSIPTLQ